MILAVVSRIIVCSVQFRVGSDALICGGESATKFPLKVVDIKSSIALTLAVEHAYGHALVFIGIPANTQWELPDSFLL